MGDWFEEFESPLWYVRFMSGWSAFFSATTMVCWWAGAATDIVSYITSRRSCLQRVVDVANALVFLALGVLFFMPTIQEHPWSEWSKALKNPIFLGVGLVAFVFMLLYLWTAGQCRS